MLLQPFRVDLPLGRPGQLMRFPGRCALTPIPKVRR